ncbi:ATP-grasp domain-containing protein [Yoonia sp. GPGPB17]|uniref:ATP-grasp domain-containing protein n=1 Tax=Yoonia sp. GPGPB17 TaxID=3026147 RepID=UPI0030C0F7BC
MQWILQQFEDTERLASALDKLGIGYSMHKVIPFVGALDPEPAIANRDAVVLFGSYTLWRYAKAHHLTPGVFKIRPFVHEAAWHPYLLNGAGALFITLKDIPNTLPVDGPDLFFRPVSDSKEVAGSVKSRAEIIAIAEKVLSIDPSEIPGGSLEHDTQLMLTQPVSIQKEWRLWVVDNKIVTYSLYKEGRRVVYRPEIDDDALAYAQHLVDANRGYSRAFVIDICRTSDGLKMIETNCINAAGFYAADLDKLAYAIDTLNGIWWRG